MCGITGFILDKSSSSINLDLIKKMTKQLERRGPDSEGYWHNEEKTQYLGHRRLSIIELSNKGAQPMQSINGNFIISFNGEIVKMSSVSYNLSYFKGIERGNTSEAYC